MASPKAYVWGVGSPPVKATMAELERAKFSTEYTKQEDAKEEAKAPAPSLMMKISPKHVDAVLAGVCLAVTIGLLHWADRMVGDGTPAGYFFAPPLMSSSFLFFAGPVPPPIRAFLLCSGIAFIGAMAVFFSGAEDAGFKLAVVGGLLLTLFKISNNFFVPTLGLAIGYITTPATLLASPLAALKFVACPWLLGHGCLYGMALASSNLRREVRTHLMRSKLRANFAHLGDSELTTVFHRYDMSF
jgi:hypothetical protein